jgi:hypothetical protein
VCWRQCIGLVDVLSWCGDAGASSWRMGPAPAVPGRRPSPHPCACHWSSPFIVLMLGVVLVGHPRRPCPLLVVPVTVEGAVVVVVLPISRCCRPCCSGCPVVQPGLCPRRHFVVAGVAGLLVVVVIDPIVPVLAVFVGFFCSLSSSPLSVPWLWCGTTVGSGIPVVVVVVVSSLS